MKTFNFKVVKALVNHYQNCVCYVLMDEQIENKAKAIDALNDDFDELMDELSECENLDEIRLLTDRPLTYYCGEYDLELFGSILDID